MWNHQVKLKSNIIHYITNEIIPVIIPVLLLLALIIHLLVIRENIAALCKHALINRLFKQNALDTIFLMDGWIDSVVLTFF